VREAATAAGCARFVYITTGGALYGDPDSLPAAESHPVRPLSPYGLSKWTLERYLALLLPASMPPATLRLANVYGPRQDATGEGGVVSVFAARMARDDPVTINGDGEQTRDFVYVRDVAVATLAALDAGRPLTVNIASACGTSINELFRLMAAECGYARPPVHGPPRPGDVRHSVLDNRLARRELGWEPRTALRDGLRETMTWVREGAPLGAHDPRLPTHSLRSGQALDSQPLE
jgi:UDP-glucose 4-epimerase